MVNYNLEGTVFSTAFFFIAIYLHDGPISNLSISVIKPKKNVTVGFLQVSELLMLAAGFPELVQKYQWLRQWSGLVSHFGALKCFSLPLFSTSCCAQICPHHIPSSCPLPVPKPVQPKSHVNSACFHLDLGYACMRLLSAISQLSSANLPLLGCAQALEVSTLLL